MNWALIAFYVSPVCQKIAKLGFLLKPLHNGANNKQLYLLLFILYVPFSLALISYAQLPRLLHSFNV